MLKLVLDSGNTCLKAALWKDKILLKVFREKSFSDLLQAFRTLKYGLPEAILFSSVSTKRVLPRGFLKQNTISITLSHQTRLPIDIRYKTPETLGFDRLANAVGSARMFPGKAVLAIDAGTCLKFDFVSSKGHYQGGSISPGIQMRFDALHHFTAQLPALRYHKKFSYLGTNTSESMVSGVQNGILNEAAAGIEYYQKKYKSLQVILTGGDYRFFAGNLKNHIFVSPNLTLLGLNEILDYNLS